MRWRIRDKIYGAEIMILCCPPAEAQRFVRSRYGDKDLITPDTTAITMVYPSKQSDGTEAQEYIIWFREVPSFNTLVHEALHLAIFVMEWNEVKVSGKHSEPLCAYLGFLFDAIRAGFQKRVRQSDRVV